MAEFTTHDGIDIHYEDRGEGHPLLFVHGWAMSGRVWHFQLKAFEGSNRVIVPDLRGHGLSGIPAGAGFAMNELVADLAALFERLELQRTTLVGWSLGAQVALEAFPVLRDRLAALVLVGGTPRFTSAEGFGYGLPPAEVRGMALRLKRDHSRAMGDFFKGMFATGEMTPEQYQRVVKEIVIPSRQPSPETALKALAALAEADQRPILPQVDRPVLLIHGSQDTICLPSASRFMAEILPDAVLEPMEGCGHAPFMTRPGEFNSLLARFLERVYGRD